MISCLIHTPFSQHVWSFISLIRSHARYRGNSRTTATNYVKTQ